MIPSTLSAAVADHLWQSTLVAAAAALLAFLLRHNHARVRYGLWLVASLKFLVPFSLLIDLGGRLGRSAGPAMRAPAVAAAVEQFGIPFTAPASPLLPPHPAGAAQAAGTGLLPAVLLALWVCGFLAVAVTWFRRWWRMRATVRAASVLASEGDVPVRLSRSLAEPGVFGVFRPVLVLPEGIADRLAPAELRAIVAHEICHIRRRDNLAGALHMLVEAVFWFHPLVWWLGARLVEERERACDEEVLRLGSDPEVYAESILKTCRFYLESPLVCASGVTGSDLKKRIVRIMTGRTAYRLALSKKLLLAAAAVAAVAGPIGFGLLNAPVGRAQEQSASAPEAFEVASIKPNKSGGRGVRLAISPGGRFRAENVTLKMLIREAWGLQDFQISGGPDWMNSDAFNVEAKAPGGTDEPAGPLDENRRKTEELHRRRMLRTLLAERFQLRFHTDTKDLPVYVLAIGKNGPKLHATETVGGDPAGADPKAQDIPFGPGAPAGASGSAGSAGRGPTGPAFTGSMRGPDGRLEALPAGPGRGFRGLMIGRGQISGQGTTLAMFTQGLSGLLGRTVLDQTGLTGVYDLTLHWTPDESQRAVFMSEGHGGPGMMPPDAPPPPEDAGPSIFTAVEEQLGLKLESKRGPVEILVIDSAQPPSAN